MVNDHVAWNLDLQIRDGMETASRAFMHEITAATRAAEPGTLNYEWSLSADGNEYHVYERYADSAATLAHLAVFLTQYVGRFLELFQPTRFVVYGTPNAEVRGLLAGWNPVYMTSAAGFSRYVAGAL